MKKEDMLVLGLIGLGLIMSSRKTTATTTPTPTTTITPTTTTTTITPTPTNTAQTETQLLNQIQTTYPDKVIIKNVDNNGNAVYSVVDQTTQTSFPVAVVKQVMPEYPTRIVEAI